MISTSRRVTRHLAVLVLAVSLSVPVTAIAHADTTPDVGVTGDEAPTVRDAFELGRFRDHSDWGDFSTPLTQSLAVLALSRAQDVSPSGAAVELLLAQQCDDGGFPNTFHAPSTEGPGPCASAVDTTAFVVQALDAAGEHDAVAAAASWLAGVQAADGSFGAADGINTNSTGLAALALTLGGHDDAAAAARAWVYTQQDGCDTDSPGAIPFNADERGIAEISTAQALLGLTSTSLAVVSSAGASPEVPDSPCEDDEVEIDDTNGNEAAATWLASALTEHPAVDTGFGPSEGPTADVLFGFAAVGVAGDTIEAIADWLSTRVGPYTQGQGFDAADAVYAGATAKLSLAMQAVGRDPRSVGGTDLLAQLGGREVTELAEVTVSCDDPEAGVEPGAEITCDLGGLIPWETVHVLVELNPVLLDEHVGADETGSASFAFTIPTDATADDEVVVSVDGLGVPALAATTLSIDDSGVIDDEDDDDDGTGLPGDNDEVGDEDVPDDGSDGSDDAGTPGSDAQDTTTDSSDAAVSAARDHLPETGAGAWVLAALAMGALSMGLVLLRLGRRTEPQT